MSRKQMVDLVTRRGGRYTASVGNATTHLIVDDLNYHTSKRVKAVLLGIILFLC